MKHGKKYVDSVKLIDSLKAYDPEEAMALVCQTSKAKFDETIEISVRLGVDPRHADQQVRGAVVLPAYLAKGLEFDAVILANAGEGHYHEPSERLLLYTAFTRALHVLRVYCVGTPSPFLPNPSQS